MSNRSLVSNWYSYSKPDDFKEFLKLVKPGDKIEIKRSDLYSHFALFDSIITDKNTEAAGGDAAGPSTAAAVSVSDETATRGSSFVSEAKSFLKQVKDIKNVDVPSIIRMVIENFIATEDESVAFSKAISLLRALTDSSFMRDVDYYVEGVQSDRQLYAKMAKTLDEFLTTDIKVLEKEDPNGGWIPEWLFPLKEDEKFKDAAKSFLSKVRDMVKPDDDVVLPNCYVIHLTSRRPKDLQPSASGEGEGSGDNYNNKLAIRRDLLNEVVEDSELFRINNGADERYKVRSETAILASAARDEAAARESESKLSGQRHYSNFITKSNCEHAVNQWRHGKSFSDQVDGWLRRFDGNKEAAENELRNVVIG